MKNNTVTTFDGTTALRRDCRYIKGEFFKKGEQCICINQRWYRINSGLIEKDYEKNEWFLKGEMKDLQEGVVGWNHGPVYGKFTPNIRKNIYLVYDDTFPRAIVAISEDVLNKANYRVVNGIYYIGKDLPDANVSNNTLYGFELPYRTVDIPPYVKKEYISKEYTRDFIDKYYSLISPLLNYSWGIEIETSKGKLPLKDCINNCLFPLRDGSISGIEYSTPPLRNYNDFFTLKEGLERLKATGHQIDKHCSLHVHVGGIKEKEIAPLYEFLVKIEKFIYSMFPKFYIKTSVFKRRDYNNPLQRFSEYTNENIFKYLSEESMPYGFYSSHPRDSANSAKWHVNLRYKFCNFVPYFFSDNKTVEFRIHVPTLNFDKIVLWMLFINAVLTHVRSGDKKPSSVRNLINSVYSSTLSEKLNKYLELRTKWYGNSRDPEGVGEIKWDNRFSLKNV